MKARADIGEVWWDLHKLNLRLLLMVRDSFEGGRGARLGGR